MAEARVDVMWAMTATLLAQIGNMRAWVFRTDKKIHTASDYPRRRSPAKKRELEPGGMEVLKELVLAGKFKPR